MALASLTEEELNALYAAYDDIFANNSENNTDEKENIFVDENKQSKKEALQLHKNSEPADKEVDDLPLIKSRLSINPTSSKSLVIKQNEIPQPEIDPENQVDFDVFNDVDMDVAVEIGRVNIKLKELLMLGEGNIIELEKNIKDLIDVRVNEELIANGEVVVIDEKFGLRIVNKA